MGGNMRSRKALHAILGVAMATFVLLPASVAFASTATATLTGGSLAFVSAPRNVTFSATLNGLDQTVTSNQGLDIGDATGSGSGWNITATSTTFTTGTNTLSTSATTVTSTPAVACDASTTCTLATNSISY